MVCHFIRKKERLVVMRCVPQVAGGTGAQPTLSGRRGCICDIFGPGGGVGGASSEFRGSQACRLGGWGGEWGWVGGESGARSRLYRVLARTRGQPCVVAMGRVHVSPCCGEEAAAFFCESSFTMVLLMP